MNVNRGRLNKLRVEHADRISCAIDRLRGVSLMLPDAEVPDQPCDIRACATTIRAAASEAHRIARELDVEAALLDRTAWFAGEVV